MHGHATSNPQGGSDTPPPHAYAVKMASSNPQVASVSAQTLGLTVQCCRSYLQWPAALAAGLTLTQPTFQE